MTFLIAFLALFALAVSATLGLWIFRSFQKLEISLGQQTQTFQKELLQISRQMNEQLTSNTSVVQGYTQLMGEFQHRLGQLQESTQSMIQIGRDISSLQDILRAPKLRGLLGELFLEDLLKQLLPQERYELQYAFRTGEKVDAIIRLGQGMVPVDAKFPLENFKRLIQSPSEDEKKRSRRQFCQDVKKHIDVIASKYIVPEEGTFDFALMYIPAENVYYETILKEEAEEGQSLVQYALNRKVIPVSPNSFYAYLQAILLGLRGLRIENSVKEILGCLAQLSVDFKKFYEHFEKLGTHLSNSKTAYEKAQKQLDRFQHQLETIESQETKPALSELTPLSHAQPSAFQEKESY